MIELDFKIPAGLYRFKPEPGEVFVIKVKEELTSEKTAAIQQAWSRRCPGVPLIIMDSTCELGIIKP